MEQYVAWWVNISDTEVIGVLQDKNCYIYRKKYFIHIKHVPNIFIANYYIWQLLLTDEITSQTILFDFHITTNSSNTFVDSLLSRMVVVKDDKPCSKIFILQNFLNVDQA